MHKNMPITATMKLWNCQQELAYDYRVAHLIAERIGLIDLEKSLAGGPQL